MKVNFFANYTEDTGFNNMEKDLSMLNFAIQNKSEEYFVRFYGWKPACITIGRNQKEFKTNAKIDIVRRPTGGRALLHDMEITYSIAGKCAPKSSILQTYKKISDILIKAFKTLDVPLEYAGERGGKNNYCMNISSGADICYKGKKLIGSAQCRKESYFLQHGSILLDADFKFLEEAFGEPVNRDKITTLKEINPNITKENLICALHSAFENCNTN